MQDGLTRVDIDEAAALPPGTLPALQAAKARGADVLNDESRGAVDLPGRDYEKFIKTLPSMTARSHYRLARGLPYAAIIKDS